MITRTTLFQNFKYEFQDIFPGDENNPNISIFDLKGRQSFKKLVFKIDFFELFHVEPDLVNFINLKGNCWSDKKKWYIIEEFCIAIND
jgi:hypothetical protein